MTDFRRVWVAAVGTAFGASILHAQQDLTKCDFSSNGRFTKETINGIEVASGSDGITVVCKDKKITLTADSGRKIGETRADLFGHVHYSEPSRIDLHSDLLTYFIQDERVVMVGHVIAKTPSGSMLTGPEATYLRVIPGRRPYEELTAVKNPTVTIAAKGDSAKPTVLTAVTIYMRGDSLVYASKSVVVTRSDMVSHSDSAFVDGRVGHETTRLMFKPSVEGLQGKKFKLVGEIIDAYSKERKLDRVIARGHGHATSQDLNIGADTIDLRIVKDALQRAIAWSSPGQATATSPGTTIVADSIDVLMPNQKVRIVYAVRRAFAQSDADSVRFRTTEKDWLRGDTVTAWFDTTATKDTSKTPPIQRVIATHRADSAKAYYHLAASDTSLHRPAVSYVRGKEIRLDFDNKKIGTVIVTGQVDGVYLEPKRDTVGAADKSKKGKTAKTSTKTSTKVPAKPPAATATIKPPPSDLREDRR